MLNANILMQTPYSLFPPYNLKRRNLNHNQIFAHAPNTDKHGENTVYTSGRWGGPIMKRSRPEAQWARGINIRQHPGIFLPCRLKTFNGFLNDPQTGVDKKCGLFLLEDYKYGDRRASYTLQTNELLCVCVCVLGHVNTPNSEFNFKIKKEANSGCLFFKI